MTQCAPEPTATGPRVARGCSERAAAGGLDLLGVYA